MFPCFGLRSLSAALLVALLICLGLLGESFMASKEGAEAVAAALEKQTRSKQKLVVVVTGASSGIGKATSLLLAKDKERFIVYATMRSVDAWTEPPIDNLRVAALGDT